MTQPTPLQRNLPNALTILRVVLAAAFFGVLGHAEISALPENLALAERIAEARSKHPELLIAALIFVIAAVTDALDGHLARRWNVVSRFGRVMDPFADKVLVLGAFVMLAAPNLASLATDHPNVSTPVSGIAPWMVVVILARELLVTSLRGLIESEGGDFSASASGKWKMILQSFAVPFILLILAFTTPYDGSTPKLFIVLTAWSTVVVTAVTAIPYICRAASR